MTGRATLGLLFFTCFAINIARAQITTTLTLTTPSSTVAYGQGITFTATLSPFAVSGVSTDGETVTFNVSTSSNPYPTPYPETLSSGVATLALAPSAVVPGPVTVTAVYGGDSLFAASSSTSVTVTVGGVPTTTTIGVTPVGSAGYSAGTPVRLYADVKSATQAVYPGQVNFCDATAAHCTDIHLLGTAQLNFGNSDGYAAITFVPGIGTHTYKAEFLGTNFYASSTSGTISFAVPGTVPSTTAVTATGSPASYTLAATVTGHGTASPTGSIGFIDTTNANQVLASAPLGAGTASLGFVNSSSPAVPYPLSVAIADLNGDGIPDLALADFNGNKVNVLLGKGDGTFTALSGAPSTGVSPNFIVAADFDGDGIPDLAVTDGNSNTVTVLLGKGDGTFTLQSSPGTGNFPISVTAADFNGDGIQDLAVANLTDQDVTVLLGSGDGTFTASMTPPPTAVKPYGIASGDWNGDGKADLVVTNELSNTLTVLLGNGDGTFSATASPSTGKNPLSVAVGDFNGDGNADLAVANGADNSITILLGDGTGKFPTSATYGVGSTPQIVAVGDFNGDGIADLAVTSYGNNTVTVLVGKGDGTFTVAGSPATGPAPYFVAIGDLNGDGLSDLAAGNINTGANNGSVTVLLSQLTQTATATATKIVAAGTGTHQVEASYPGDNYYNPSSGNTSVIAVSPPVCTLSVLATSTPLTVLAQTNCTDPQNLPLIVTINWGDGTSSTAGTTNTHTYSAAGTYTVVLSATDSLGLTGSVQGVISPNQAPACTLGVASGGAPSNPATVPISIPGNCTDPQNQPLTTTINWGDGTSPQVASNPQTYSHDYPQPPVGASPVTYPVTLSATDSSGLSGISNVQRIQVNPQQPPVQSGGSTAVSGTIPAPPPTVVATQVTFICSSVSAIIGGQTVNNALPSQFGISCSSPTVTLSSGETPVNITINTTTATLVASTPSGTLSVVYGAIVFPLSGLTLLWLGTSRSRSRNSSSNLWIAIGLITLLCFGVTACGGHFTLPTVTATPTGQYYLTVTETVVHPPAPTGFIQTSLIVPLPVTGSTP
jgi:hypothetical protein